jgi:hypothetical protein
MEKDQLHFGFMHTNAIISRAQAGGALSAPSGIDVLKKVSFFVF